jgi:predicted PolB exonuclease-like 3'-5' exonuclease
MKMDRIVAIDIESCSASRKYPALSDLILGISVHTALTIDPASPYQGRLFIANELTYEAEEEILVAFLDFLTENKGAILTSYNLMGFDQPILLTRSKEHYPLSFQLLDIMPKFSLYDTMIAYKAYVQSPTSCRLLQAIEQLRAEGQSCFLLNSKVNLSGKDILSLWAKHMAGVSKEFSTYMSEDSYNHLRLAQVLLSSNAKEGFWNSEALKSNR